MLRQKISGRRPPFLASTEQGFAPWRLGSIWKLPELLILDTFAASSLYLLLLLKDFLNIFCFAFLKIPLFLSVYRFPRSGSKRQETKRKKEIVTETERSTDRQTYIEIGKHTLRQTSKQVEKHKKADRHSNK